VADAWVRRLRAVPDSIDALMALYAPDVDFADPTFQLGLHNRDTFRAEILRYARATAATAPEMIILDRFLSGAFIALWGRYTEQIRAEEPDRRIGMRYLTVLELANGKIVRHRDYYEAEPYRAAKRAG
jgi:ketosteroid isomerase-like protein